MPDLQETVAMTVEQYYHTRVKPKEAQPRLPGDRRYRTLDEAARARSGIYALRNESKEKSNMILVREMDTKDLLFFGRVKPNRH